jgi:hypothetical protein
MNKLILYIIILLAVYYLGGILSPPTPKKENFCAPCLAAMLL